MKGAIAVFMATAIVPTVLLLTIGSLSLSRFYYRLEQQQKIVDTAAMLAGSAYPDVELARSKAQSYVELRSDLKIKNLEVSFEDRLAIIKLNSSYKMELVDYFGIRIEIPIFQSAKAIASSQNIVLAIDTSTYLAPDPFGDLLWSENKYPAANFIHDNFSGLNLSRYATSPEVLTQACFNPLIDAVKKTALEITAYARMSPESNYALAVFPGYENHYDEIFYQGGGNQELSASYNYQFNAATLCAAAAEREYSTVKYRFPMGQAVFGVDYFINQDDLSFNEGMLSRLSPEEQIWSLSAKRPEYQYAIDHLIRYILSSLSGTYDNFSASKAIILAGDMPRFYDSRYPQTEARRALLDSIELLEQLAMLSQRKLKLYYLFFENKFNKMFSAEEVWQLQTDINSTIENQALFSVQLKIIDSDNDYSSDIYEILLEDQHVVSFS